MVNKRQAVQQSKRVSPTQLMVAAEAGVSRETVSHILGGRAASRYSEETRRKVLEAADRLGYLPNRAAQIMRNGKSGQIGIIHFGLIYESGRRVIRHLPAILHSHGYDVFVADLSWQGSGYRRVIEQLVQMRVEGVIISQTVESFGEEQIRILKRHGIPVVSIAGNDNIGIPVVYTDSCKAVQELTHHLMDVGHRRILTLVTNYQGRSTLSRIQGFTQAIKECGGDIVGDDLSVAEWLRGDRQGIQGKVMRVKASAVMGVYAEVNSLIKEGVLPDAILCSNDHWAMQAFAACAENGLSVPDDIAITGYDNDVFGAYAPYHLTTIKEPREAQCELAVEILMELIKGNKVAKQHYVFPGELVIRRSCGSGVGDKVSG